MNKFKSILCISSVPFLISSCGPKIYESAGAAKRACERWAEKAETIWTASSRPVTIGYTLEDTLRYSPNTYETNMVASNGQPIVAQFFPIGLRMCQYDYDTTAYIGYQHKGIDRISINDFPKRKDGKDWVTLEGKKLKLFKSWDVEGGEKVKSYKF